MKNFKLWMGCLGNGITVCNSAIEMAKAACRMGGERKSKRRTVESRS